MMARAVTAAAAAVVAVVRVQVVGAGMRIGCLLAVGVGVGVVYRRRAGRTEVERVPGKLRPLQTIAGRTSG